MTDDTERIPVTDSEILAALGRISASGVLGDRSRLERLLRFLVIEEIEGRGARLKAYTIGTEALGRGTDFDPNSDSIVRVDASRLRSALEHYYATKGDAEAVRIEIPKGTYRPVIHAAPVVARTNQRKKPFENKYAYGFFTVAVLASVLLLMWEYMQAGKSERLPARVAGTPVLDVMAFDAPEGSQMTFVAQGIREQLIVDLTHLGTLQVRDLSNSVSEPNAVRRGDDAARYSLTGSIPPTGEQSLLLLRLTNPANGKVVWTRQVTLPRNDSDYYGLLRDTIGSLAFELGGEGGAVPKDVLRRFDVRLEELGNAETSEYECLLRAFAYDSTKDPGAEDTARKCLTTLVTKNSKNSSIWASYALMGFLDWARSGGYDGAGIGINEAMRAARRAVQLDPFNAIAHEHLGSILSAQGHRDDAIAAYRRGLELAPSKPSLNFLLGWQVVLTGDWADGMRSVERGVHMSVSAPGYMRIPLALDAFRRKDYARSLVFAETIIQLGDPRGLPLAFAAALGVGDLNRTEEYLSELKLRADFDPRDPFKEIRNSFSNPSVMRDYDALTAKSGLL